MGSEPIVTWISGEEIKVKGKHLSKKITSSESGIFSCNASL